ncbi:MAG: TMEM175 family protein [Chloroflexota bacterium]|nr:TMEM175 family protein [Chloroflexota bacterium]
MTLTSYNEIAARGLDRIAALSDGLFAIAMTLIVFEIRVPDPGPIHSDGDLFGALLLLGPRIVTYLLSFMTLGIFWNGQQTQLNHIARADRHLAWLSLAFLATVAVMPFSTSLLAEFITFRLALILYWLNIVACGALLYAIWAYAGRAGLLKSDTPPEVRGLVRRRIIGAQALYAIGAALCLVPFLPSSTYWSIAFIVLVQLNFAVAPRIPWLSKL